uniref:Uncharacterized protein n=1 Tax=viral metagenome TaxID=1070528 RepID=A0A6C0ATW0_9ZZZZ
MNLLCWVIILYSTSFYVVKIKIPSIVITIPTIFLVVYCSRKSAIPTINKSINENDFKIIVFTDGVLCTLSNCSKSKVEHTVSRDTKKSAAICVYVREQQFSIVLFKNRLSKKYS